MPRRAQRLDTELVRRGLVPGPAEAADAIAGHRVLVDGLPAFGGSRQVAGSSALHVLPPPGDFVSRGGRKLDPALDALGVDPSGRRCLDAGAGSGGFTDCLLRRGATEVVAVDVGYGDFAWELRNDPRVHLHERLHIAKAGPAVLAPGFGLVVADLSFISLTSVAPSLAGAVLPGGDLVALVKPQFEAPRGDVGPGGVVTDPGVWERCVQRVADAMAAQGLRVRGSVASALRGASGNQEFFLHAHRDLPGEP